MQIFLIFVTGVFEPPMDGVYFLTVYATTNGQNGPMYIKNNDDILCTTFITDGVQDQDMGIC